MSIFKTHINTTCLPPSAPKPHQVTPANLGSFGLQRHWPMERHKVELKLASPWATLGFFLEGSGLGRELRWKWMEMEHWTWAFLWKWRTWCWWNKQTEPTKLDSCHPQICWCLCFCLFCLIQTNVSGWTVDLMKDIMKHETVHDLSSHTASFSSVQGE